MTGVNIIRPQPGSQMQALACSADIMVYGGVAGAGKTYQLLLEATRYIDNPGFTSLCFRRTSPQIMAPGGLWEEARKLYRHWNPAVNMSRLEFKFSSGATIRFAHMEREENRYDWDGSQIALIMFDQLEHFTEKQFWYMLSRNRSTCGVKPYIRASCNPDPDHFLRHLMSWWIDDDTGFAIKERSGILRYFIRLNDEIIWADTRDELAEEYSGMRINSFTFIRGVLEENKVLLKANPDYISRLEGLRRVDRARLREGNWNTRETAGDYFQRSWFEFVDAAPALERQIRYWDRAGTEADKAKAKGSWTAGCRMGVTRDGVFYVTDVARFQESPPKVKKCILHTATQDGRDVMVGIEQDPGQAGKAEAEDQVRNLAGFVTVINTVRESKGVRAKPVSSQAEANNIKIVRGHWNEAFMRELESFDGSDKCMADQVDALSGAFHILTNRPPQPRVTFL